MVGALCEGPSSRPASSTPSRYRAPDTPRPRRERSDSPRRLRRRSRRQTPRPRHRPSRRAASRGRQAAGDSSTQASGRRGMIRDRCERWPRGRRACRRGTSTPFGGGRLACGGALLERERQPGLPRSEPELLQHRLDGGARRAERQAEPDSIGPQRLSNPRQQLLQHGREEIDERGVTLERVCQPARVSSQRHEDVLIAFDDQFGMLRRDGIDVARCPRIAKRFPRETRVQARTGGDFEAAELSYWHLFGPRAAEDFRDRSSEDDVAFAIPFELQFTAGHTQLHRTIDEIEQACRYHRRRSAGAAR